MTIVLILGIICIIAFAIIKMRSKNQPKVSKKIKICCGIEYGCIIAFLVVLLLNRVLFNAQPILDIITQIILGIGGIILIITAIISIKNKEKLPPSILLLQGIVIVTIITMIVTNVIENNKFIEESKYIEPDKYVWIYL